MEFIYDPDCPNVTDARNNLREPLAAAGWPRQWREWDRGKPDSPDYARRYGSPTILVDGRDAVGVAPSDDRSCRIYSMEPGRRRRVAAVAEIIEALNRAPRRSQGVVARSFAALPVIGAVILPKLTCPVCWPA